MAKLVKCPRCLFWSASEPYTLEELSKVRRDREQKGLSADVPERPGTCHFYPPKVEVVPTMAGPTSLSVWPQTHRDDPNAFCGCGIAKEEA